MKEKIIELLRKISRDGIDKLILYLSEQCDYFKAPASTNYHGNFEGGLAEHCYNVYQLLKEKNERFNLELTEDSIVIIGLLHDFCKINFYQKVLKSVILKDEKGNAILNNFGKKQWKDELVWEVKDESPLGHGEKSVILLQNFIKLLPEEIALIRWHMGGHTAGLEQYEMGKSYSAICEQYPAIATMIASDIEASYLLERKK